MKNKTKIMSETIDPPVQLKLRMKGVELVKSQINSQPPNFTAAEFQFTVNLETRLDPVQKIAIIITTADVKSDNKPDVHGVLSSACIYGIDNFEDIFKQISSDKFDAPDQIMFTLISISLSTLRGIMFEQFRGTYLHQAYLPIMDPKLFKAATKK
jgi:hypothetical protein